MENGLLLTFGMSDEKNPRTAAERAWAAVTEIGQTERHFNEMQASYRRLASNWLLASLGALGYLAWKVPSPDFVGLTAPSQFGSPSAEVLVMVVVAASIGILALWVIDVHVYHTILNANFLEGLALEDKHDSASTDPASDTDSRASHSGHCFRYRILPRARLRTDRHQLGTRAVKWSIWPRKMGGRCYCGRSLRPRCRNPVATRLRIRQSSRLLRAERHPCADDTEPFLERVRSTQDHA
jgi:hypothetical protein